MAGEHARIVGVGVQHNLTQLPRGDGLEIRLRDVRLDLERAQIGDRDHGALGKRARRERRHNLADIGVLAQYGAVERRANHRVLQRHVGRLDGRLSDRDARPHALVARLGRVVARL